MTYSTFTITMLSILWAYINILFPSFITIDMAYSTH